MRTGERELHEPPTTAAEPKTTVSGAHVRSQALLLCCCAANASYSLTCWYRAEEGPFCTQLITLCKSTTLRLWRGTKKRSETKEKERALRVCKELKACSANIGTSLQQTQRHWRCSYPCDHGHYCPMRCLLCWVPWEEERGGCCGPRAASLLYHHAGLRWDSS